MINFLGCSAQGIAVANGVTTLALLERSGSHSQRRLTWPLAGVRGLNPLGGGGSLGIAANFCWAQNSAAFLSYVSRALQ